MRLAPFIPVLILGAILFHSTRGLREKITGLMGFGNRVKAQKQLLLIKKRVQTRNEGHLLSSLDFAGQSQWIRRWVIDPEGKKRDMSLDPWGKAIRFKPQNTKLIILSAGSDKVYETKDDVKETMFIEE